MSEWTYRCEFVRCGRCKGRCAHGPYWYGYRREGKKVKKRYFGKQDPRAPRPTPEVEKAAQWDLLCDMMLHKQTASELVALGVLEIDYLASRDETFRAYRRQQLKHHPDRGGTVLASQAINAAWSYLKAWYRW